MKKNFYQRKASILSKEDKSFKKNWDKKISSLCKKINSFENYYTTSSCSGRVVLIIDSSEKRHGLFLRVYHDLIEFSQIKSDLEKIESRKIVKFKQEPPILHVICKELDDAKRLLKKARNAGWKRSGIMEVSDKGFLLELISTEKLEFPIIHKKLLVNDEFLKLIIIKSNLNLKKGWSKINKLNAIL